MASEKSEQSTFHYFFNFYYIFLLLSLQIISVVRKPAMRTPRNMFIVNLAVADLLLCTVTMPLTLMEILTKYFPLGNNLFICKLIGILQATSTYVSTISITAIALDRYQVSDGVLICFLFFRIYCRSMIQGSVYLYHGGREIWVELKIPV